MWFTRSWADENRDAFDFAFGSELEQVQVVYASAVVGCAAAASRGRGCAGSVSFGLLSFVSCGAGGMLCVTPPWYGHG